MRIRILFWNITKFAKRHPCNGQSRQGLVRAFVPNRFSQLVRSEPSDTAASSNRLFRRCGSFARSLSTQKKKHTFTRSQHSRSRSNKPNRDRGEENLVKIKETKTNLHHFASAQLATATKEAFGSVLIDSSKKKERKRKTNKQKSTFRTDSKIETKRNATAKPKRVPRSEQFSTVAK